MSNELPGAEANQFFSIVGSSTAIRAVRSKIATAARNQESVLIVGETGTGKELVARGVHARSSRSASQLAIINCAAIPSELIHSELFGHVSGSFTGASRDRRGRLYAANGSSVFLDEICSTTREFQVALLRTVEYGDVQQVGSDSCSRRVDLRFIAATSQSIEQLREGRVFRPDLFFRLAGTLIEISPLRSRKEDIPSLIWHFLEQAAARYGREKRLGPSVMDTLMKHDFPGNVRELRQVILNAYSSAPDDTIRHSDVHFPFGPTSEPTPKTRDACNANLALHPKIRDHIVRTLVAANGNLSLSARLLEVPRSTLQHYVAKYEIAVEGFRNSERSARVPSS